MAISGSDESHPFPTVANPLAIERERIEIITFALKAVNYACMSAWCTYAMLISI